VRYLKDSLFIAREFLNAKKLRTLQGAKINSSRTAGVEQIFAWKRISRPHFLAKIPKSSQTIFQMSVEKK
jgi:hypothetical protein